MRMVPHKLLCLNVWSLVVGKGWEGLGGMILLVEGVSLGVGFEVSEAHPIPG